MDTSGVVVRQRSLEIECRSTHLSEFPGGPHSVRYSTSLSTVGPSFAEIYAHPST